MAIEDDAFAAKTALWEAVRKNAEAVNDAAGSGPAEIQRIAGHVSVLRETLEDLERIQNLMG